jgi:hypothetical protein
MGVGPVPPRISLRTIAAALLAWTIVGLLCLSQMWLQEVSDHAPPLDWRRAARLCQDVWAWAAYTPVILWLAERLPFDGGRWGRRLPLHVAMALGFAVVDAVIANLLAPVLGPFPAHGFVSAFARQASLSVISYFAILGIGHALRYQRLHAEGRLHESELERQLAQARLGALEAQLRPHFLFNALHAVSALVRAGEQKAAIRTIAALGDILRAALRDGGDQEIPLDDELRIAQRYLEIERARFEDRLEVHIDVGAELGTALVPRFVLQPLLENAIRHGIERRSSGGTITVRAAREGATLRIDVEDRGEGPAQPRVRGAGVGLANTRARLRHLYGAEARLDLESVSGGATVARLTVPYRPVSLELVA